MAADPACKRATYEDVLAAPIYAEHRGAYADEAKVRAEPFDAIELDLALLWADVARRTDE
jgi:hypothetical protein